MQTIRLAIAPHTLNIHLPHGECNSVLYLPMHGSAQDICDLLPPLRAAIVTIDGFDWNRDLSPWSVKAAFGEEDFGGQADIFLQTLTNTLIPAAEHAIGQMITNRMIAGYSLAGLFAMYATYQANAFHAAASVSGSMWFDGWTEYAQTHPLRSPLQTAYFSVGAKEKRTRNPRMAAVEERTREMNALMKARGIISTFELNPGNHFVDVERRMAAAIQWLLTQSTTA